MQQSVCWASPVPSAQFETVRDWLALLTLAHRIDPSIPVRLSGQLEGEGFYRAWLRFAAVTVGLTGDVVSGAITAQTASDTVRVALEQLANRSQPFTGKPRACDLYLIHSLIHDVVERSLEVVQPADLEVVIDHLIAIGDGTTTSLMGMAGNGPLATNDLLEILSRVSAQVGVHAIHRLLGVIRERRNDANTMYSVMADFELATARICVDAGAHTEANNCWRRAATLLASYGGHKDPTIYEFIDSVKDLATVDLQAARGSLAKLLDPAYLVRQHSDGRGTSHVPNSWWETAAIIDPIASAWDASHVLLAEPGFEDARAQTVYEKLLETQASIADPVVLAGLRLASGATWRSPDTDVQLLKRLLTDARTDTTKDSMIASFANNVAASYDDQPLMYAVETTKTVATEHLISAVLELGGTGFSIREVRKEHQQRNSFDTGRDAKTTGLKQRLEDQQRPVLPRGAAGVVFAARDYASKSYGDNPDAPRWSIDAFVNAVGWRVVEATLSGGHEDGVRLLNDVAREISAYSDNEVFALLGEGLAARCGNATAALKTVASYCLVLAYVRIRGGGGWRSFAGSERVDLWKEAHLLDPDMAERTLAAAVTAVITSQTEGTYGVTQSIVAAFAAQPPQQLEGTAANCWDAGCSVLLARVSGEAEKMHHSYTPTTVPDPDGELDIALATLSLTAITQPKRSDLRRALLTAALFVSCRPQVAQQALVHIFGHKLDAGRTTWLLEVVDNFLMAGELTADMSATLARLSQDEKLSVRTLAGQILRSHNQPVPHPPVTLPAARLRELSGSSPSVEPDLVERAQRLVDEILADRLDEMDEYPNLLEEVVGAVANRFDFISERMKQQFENLCSPSSKRTPDAYFADEEAAEDELQTAAGGVRTMLASLGVIADPTIVEMHVAEGLMRASTWSLRDEASRVPRPTTRAEENRWTLKPVPWLENEGADWPPMEATALEKVRNISTIPFVPVHVEEEPYRDWVQVALFERMRTLAIDHKSVPRRNLIVATGLETDAPTSTTSLPLSICPPDLWARPYGELVSGLDASRARKILSSDRGPLAALADTEDQRVGPQHGPGLHPFLLSPRIEVVALLGLRPESSGGRYLLIDDAGPAALCRQWQSFLIHDGTYKDLVPAVHGADLILRGDLFDELVGAAGRPRLSLGLTVHHWTDGTREVDL